jgi:hypothetical protein
MPERDGYDVEMIRDFLEQLLWEVRVNHFDNTNKNPDNPELAEQLKKYHRKYQRTLVPFIKLDTAGLDKQQIDDGRQRLRSRVAALRQRQLDALESLQPLFEYAMIAAQQPSSVDHAPVIPVRVDQIDQV